MRLSQVAGADEQAAVAAEAQYQHLLKEYQQEQQQKKKQEEAKKPRPKAAPAPAHAPAPVLPPPVPPAPPKQLKQAAQQAAAAVITAAKIVYQTFVQPVISAVGRCITQPSAGSCLAAATIALTLIPALRAEEGAGEAAASCGLSFAATTKVLLANGKAVPISQLKPGDKVRATSAASYRPDSGGILLQSSAILPCSIIPRTSSS